jgi:formyltetrahydrofolate-dependent phosphoribosylglycinamide formyltransferase
MKVGFLVSGGGTTVANCRDLVEAGELDIEISVVVASRPGTKAIARAESWGVPSFVVPRKECADAEEFGRRITEILDAHGVELVCLAGFLSLYPIPPHFEGKVLNIHPALIPAFCGKGYYGHHVHEAVIASGVKVSGCTVHIADNEYDHGPIVLQRTVPVTYEDDPDTLAARVFEQECIAYPEAIRLFAAGRVEIHGDRVRVLPPS